MFWIGFLSPNRPREAEPAAEAPLGVFNGLGPIGTPSTVLG